MKMISRLICLLAAVGFLLSLNMAQSFAAGSAMTDWDREIISGTGYGVADPARAKNPGHARIMAHQAAMLDAYRRLAEQAKGIHVTANSSISDNISTGDVVTGEVDAVVKRARVVSENYDEYGNCSVVLEVPLFGVTNSIAKAVLKPVAKEAFPAPTVNEATIQSTVNVTITGGYTGLIIDCSGLGLKPVMSPVIRNASQQPIYGYKNLDYDRVIDKGMASYASGMNGNLSRAGSNPLIIKAVRVEDHNSYPVVDTADADRILLENQKSHFLDSCAVVFVR
jgi:hypothetical protein